MSPLLVLTEHCDVCTGYSLMQLRPLAAIFISSNQTSTDFSGIDSPFIEPQLESRNELPMTVKTINIAKKQNDTKRTNSLFTGASLKLYKHW